jgi:outer membrane protein
MRLKSLVLAIAAVSSLTPIASQAQSSSENPWMVRVRAVDLLWQNGQSGSVVQGADVKAANKVIPELDVSYFFTKNIAAELVLTYPQTIDINYTSSQTKLGSIKALPPSLLLQYHFTNFGAFKPYVGAGVGMLRANAKAKGETIKHNRFAIQGIVGAKYEICESFDAFADFTYSYSSIEGNSYKPYGLRVGAAYKF